MNNEVGQALERVENGKPHKPMPRAAKMDAGVRRQVSNRRYYLKHRDEILAKQRIYQEAKRLGVAVTKEGKRIPISLGETQYMLAMQKMAMMKKALADLTKALKTINKLAD